MTEAPPQDFASNGGTVRRLPAFHPSARLLTAETSGGIHPNCRPRDAATLIVVDETGPAPKLLMGQRHRGHKFMPGKFVFPGGRVEPQDYLAPQSFSIPAPVEAKLVRSLKGVPHPRRAHALINAALRETREETGLVISMAPDDPAEQAHSRIAFIARAITPAGRPRRFDTRFFVLPATRIAARLDIVDGEFSGIHWLSLAEARAADLPLITRVVLDELEERIQISALDDHDRPVPFYFRRGACFHRREL